MQRHFFSFSTAAACAGLFCATLAGAGDEFKPFSEVAKDYEKVVSTVDGSGPFYGVYLNEKDNQLLAELPRGWSRQKHYFAVTQASGSIFAGLQGPSRYVYWKRFGKRMALIAPQLGTRSDGEPESKSSVERLFTDRVLVDVPIVTMGPSGQPVIDLDKLLLNKASAFIGRWGQGINSRLASVASVKAFPQNIEVELEAPMRDGQFGGLHYSISLIPDNTGYRPREADERVGYFTTVYRDLGEYNQKKKWVRYIDRWKLEKRDPSLEVSPPKEPIVFYVEHTVPVRYRRWIRQGATYWNEAFREVGLDNAIEILYQDKVTGAHMDKDPEDVRYNFIRWLNNDISTAIGPHRSHPLTGQILDADIVLTDGWIRAYWSWYNEQAPELAMEGFSAKTLNWLEDYPEWDPRMLLSTPEQRKEIKLQIAERNQRIAEGEDVEPLPSNPALLYNEDYAAIDEWIGSESELCMAAHGLAYDMAFGRLNLEMLELVDSKHDEGDGDADGDKRKDDAQKLDGIPEWFVGPLLADLVAHEVGHTLGLRHNFKSSSIYSMEQINSKEWKGKKPLAGSVMDYLPPNFNMDAGEIQGDFTMISVGPYDKWAIEYGYTFDDPKEVLKRVAEPELAYLTDDDTGGPDPLARRYDFAADPLEYGRNQMRLIEYHRGRILDEFVEEGESWSNARRGYLTTLSMQIRMLSMMSNWVGGAHIHRDHKGDPNGRKPIEVIDPDTQRQALEFVIENAFRDEVFGLSPKLLTHMTVDKWTDRSGVGRAQPTWPVHDRIMAIQGATLTMIMNPQTLQNVYDNEFRTPDDQEALTLPEVMQNLVDEIYRELETDLDGETFTNREPMISSLRRNLQSSMTDRLIDLAVGDWWMPRPIRTLATHHLRGLDDQLEEVLEKSEKGQIDSYTVAHLEDIQDRVDKALNKVYVTEM